MVSLPVRIQGARFVFKLHRLSGASLGNSIRSKADDRNEEKVCSCIELDLMRHWASIMLRPGELPDGRRSQSARGAQEMDTGRAWLYTIYQGTPERLHIQQGESESPWLAGKGSCTSWQGSRQDGQDGDKGVNEWSESTMVLAEATNFITTLIN